MGRSAVLATVSSTVRRPALASMSPSPRMYSPGIISCCSPLTLPSPRGGEGKSSADRMMDGDELGPVGERALDLDLVEHLRHTLHHIAARKNGHAEGHQVGHAATVANALEDLGCNVGERLGIVQ